VKWLHTGKEEDRISDRGPKKGFYLSGESSEGATMTRPGLPSLEREETEVSMLGGGKTWCMGLGRTVLTK